MAMISVLQSFLNFAPVEETYVCSLTTGQPATSVAAADVELEVDELVVEELLEEEEVGVGVVVLLFS